MWPFTRKRPGVFHYKIGGERRSIDGFHACTELEKDEQFKWEDIDVLLEPGPENEPLAAEEQTEASDAILAGFRRVFSLPEYDNGTGFTDSEIFGLVSDFTVWVYLLKKNIGSPQTSARPTAEPPSNWTQSNGSDSGSTSPALSTGRQA